MLMYYGGYLLYVVGTYEKYGEKSICFRDITKTRCQLKDFHNLVTKIPTDILNDMEVLNGISLYKSYIKKSKRTLFNNNLIKLC